jgi:hypothetical protein
LDFHFPLTSNAAIWFDARTGLGSGGSYQPFPYFSSNGFDNPYLITPGFTSETGTGNDNPPVTIPPSSFPYPRGMLACWVTNPAGTIPIKYNHITGTATVWDPILGAYEYNAFAFFVNSGVEGAEVCTPQAPPAAPLCHPDTLNLNGVEYDQCPEYLIGQFTPEGAPVPPGAFPVLANRLAFNGCTINLNQDWAPIFTKILFEVWNADERKLTGAFECADTWHETEFNAPPTIRSGGWIDSGAQSFQFAFIGTYSARYRARPDPQSQLCNQPNNPARQVGILGVQSSLLPTDAIGTTTAVAGRFTGTIRWDPGLGPGEGGIR